MASSARRIREVRGWLGALSATRSLVLLTSLAGIVAAPLLAQEVGTTCVAVPRKTAARDTAPVGPDSPILYGLALAVTAALAAPSAYALLPLDSTRDTVPPSSRPRLSAWASVGTAFSHNPDVGFTHSENARLAVGNFRADLGVASFHLVPQRIEYLTGRIGWLGRQGCHAAGGVMIGYRGMRGPPILGRQQGVEIGLPLVISTRRVRWRLESYYVVSRRETDWNFRLEADRLQRDRMPLFTGLKLELMSLPIGKAGGVRWGTFGAVIGLP